MPGPPGQDRPAQYRRIPDASPSLRITIDGAFEFDGTSYAMPQISVSEPFSSLPDIPGEVVRQVESDGAAIFAGFRASAAAYLDVVRQGLVTASAVTSRVSARTSIRSTGSRLG